MDKLQLAFTFAYLLTSCYFSLRCLKLFQGEDRLSPENMFLSLVTLSIVVLSWPVVISFSGIQAFQAKRLELGNAISAIVLLVILTVSGLAVFARSGL